MLDNTVYVRLLNTIIHKIWLKKNTVRTTAFEILLLKSLSKRKKKKEKSRTYSRSVYISLMKSGQSYSEHTHKYTLTNMITRRKRNIK
jgi:hypothetical protein